MVTKPWYVKNWISYVKKIRSVVPFVAKKPASARRVPKNYETA
jgi:hypothetical protein